MPPAQQRHFASDMQRFEQTRMHEDNVIEQYWCRVVGKYLPGYVHFERLPGSYLAVYTAANWGDFKPHPR